MRTIRLVLGPMSFDSGARPPRANRRLVLLLSALAAIVLAGVGGVALFSGDSWRDEAMSSGVFPNLPGSEFSSTETDEPWWTTSGDASSSPSAVTTTAPDGTVTIVPATAPATTSSTSAVPTSTVPAPVPTTTQAPSQTGTPTPSPSSTKGPGPKPKPTKSTPPPPPSPTPSPTSSKPGCWLLIIC